MGPMDQLKFLDGCLDDEMEVKTAKGWLVILGMDGGSLARSNVNRSAGALLIYIKILLIS
jgi:hypothetical protein